MVWRPCRCHQRSSNRRSCGAAAASQGGSGSSRGVRDTESTISCTTSSDGMGRDLPAGLPDRSRRSPRATAGSHHGQIRLGDQGSPQPQLEGPWRALRIRAGMTGVRTPGCPCGASASSRRCIRHDCAPLGRAQRMLSMSTHTTPSTANPIEADSRPRRITITVEEHIYHSLRERSRRERRSISNLAAHLLAEALLNGASVDD